MEKKKKRLKVYVKLMVLTRGEKKTEKPEKK
jgi:hypothetical protein